MFGRSTRSVLNIVLIGTAFMALFAPLALPIPGASASHSQSYVFPGAPYSGTWNLGNNVPPEGAYMVDPHHRLWGGSWATDFFKEQYTIGHLYLATNDGSPYAIMAQRTPSCGNPNLYAGEAYKFDLYNASGRRGFVEYAHVSNWDPQNYQEWALTNGQYMGPSAIIGWTAWWGGPGTNGVGTCYEVRYPGSVHWHVETANDPSVGHYSCHYPPNAEVYRYAGDWLGIAGANTTSAPAQC